MAALGLGAAACGNLIGLEEWKDPVGMPDEASSQGGSGGGGGGGGDFDGPSGAGGAGGAGGTATSSGAGGGGGVPVQEPGPACEACMAGCAAEIQACENDASCKQHYRPCLIDGGPCCKASGGAWAGSLAQAAYTCLLEKCELDCAVSSHCADCLIGPAETDVDCGGDACAPCEAGQKCTWDGDCRNLACSSTGTCL